MLLVQFSFIEPKIDTENLDKEKYVGVIFSKLEEEGLIDLCVYRPTGEKDELKKVQDISNTSSISYSTKHIREFQINADTPCESQPSSLFEIQYVWETYQSMLRLSIKISSDSYQPTVSSDYLEQLKFSVKKTIIRDWKRVEWLIDKDSECLAVDLYPEIFRTENLIRQMITELMTKHYGDGWWDTFVPINIKSVYSARIKEYKSIAPGFSNVDDRLLSINLGDLKRIIQQKTFKWVPSYSSEISSMISGLIDWSDSEVHNILSRQTAVEVDLWNEHFSMYLPRDFLEDLTDFEKNRNHVAHNKLLDRQAYGAIKRNTEKIKSAVEVALNRISHTVLSEESLAFIASAEARENSIMKSEAGVSIFTDTEIGEVLATAFCELCENVREALRFREDIAVDFTNEELRVNYKINEQAIIVVAEVNIDDSQGAESGYYLSIADDDEFHEKLIYRNGAAEFNEEQACYLPLTAEEKPDVDAASKNIVEYINERFPNLRQAVDAVIYRRRKDGDLSPIIFDCPCEECGEYYIAADYTFEEPGTCLNCGAKNEVVECDCCGTFFVGSEVEDGLTLCEQCLERLESE